MASADAQRRTFAQAQVSTAGSSGNQIAALPDTRADGRFLGVRDHAGITVGGFSQRSAFPWVKFSFILVAILAWLRMMRLCVDDGSNLELQVDKWGQSLFAIGLAGILVAILVPAYLLGACVLVAACGLPFWRFIRWRNAQVSDETLQLGWHHLFVSPAIPFRPAPDVQFALPSSLAANVPSGTISLVGKSFTDRITQAAAEKPSGFQWALAVLGHAIAKRATDIHLGTKDNQVALRLRVDGELVPLEPLSIESGLLVINVFKVLSDLSIADKRRAQDGSFRADVDGRRLCFRVSSQGTNTGEKLSIRILDPAANLATFSALGVNARLEERLLAMLSRKSGLTLFAGATGAGKSTTAYAGLRYLDSGERNIVTIEDPIEYSIPSIDQIEVKSRSGQTFKLALRSLLRQDADIVLIGEIRDEETAKTACQAATTGQLVLSTLHSTDSISALFRMMDLGVDPYNTAAALRCVVSQQLIRKLCIQCRIAYTPDEETLRKLGLLDFHGELYHSPDPQTNPCLHCNGRGFLGRTGIFELLELNRPIRDLIRDRASATAITSAALENGMTTLWDDGLRLVRDGIISPLEFYRVVDES